MTEREQKIRELIERLAKPESGVSREYTILNVSDAEFLLTQLTAERLTTKVYREGLNVLMLKERLTWFQRFLMWLKDTSVNSRTRENSQSVVKKEQG